MTLTSKFADIDNKSPTVTHAGIAGLVGFVVGFVSSSDQEQAKHSSGHSHKQPSTKPRK